MTNETTENFLTAMAEVFGNLPEVKQPGYRIYYDDEGRPLSYSVDDLPGNYIEVDAVTYSSPDMNIRIIDGKIVKIKPPVQIAKLVPSDLGICCDPTNVCVIVDSGRPHTKWSLKHREIY